MILFSIIQLFANGWRVVQWRSYVLWPIFGWYLAGAAISFAGMWMIAFVPDKAMVYLALGLMPFAVEALQRWSRFAGQFGGLAKVDSGFDYAANFSSFACLA
jgi:hypothetical protein